VLALLSYRHITFFLSPLLLEDEEDRKALFFSPSPPRTWTLIGRAARRALSLPPFPDTIDAEERFPFRQQRGGGPPFSQCPPGSGLSFSFFHFFFFPFRLRKETKSRIAHTVVRRLSLPFHPVGEVEMAFPFPFFFFFFLSPPERRKGDP